MDAGPLEIAWKEYADSCRLFGITEGEIAGIKPTFFAGALMAAYACAKGAGPLIVAEGETYIALETARSKIYSR